MSKNILTLIILIFASNATADLLAPLEDYVDCTKRQVVSAGEVSAQAVRQAMTSCSGFKDEYIAQFEPRYRGQIARAIKAREETRITRLLAETKGR